MIDIILRAISTTGTIIAAATLVWGPGPEPTPWIRFLLLALIGVSVIVTGMDIAKYRAGRPKRYEPSSPEINSYMVDWLNRGGRSAVFSRDLSWANSGKTADVLTRKANLEELLVFAGRQASHVTNLAKAGAEVHDYGSLGFEPKSRFTIIDYGKAGARLAIGFAEDGKHAIYEYGPADHAVMALATDLVELARATAPLVPR